MGPVALERRGRSFYIARAMSRVMLSGFPRAAAGVALVIVLAGCGSMVPTPTTPAPTATAAATAAATTAPPVVVPSASAVYLVDDAGDAGGPYQGITRHGQLGGDPQVRQPLLRRRIHRGAERGFPTRRHGYLYSGRRDASPAGVHPDGNHRGCAGDHHCPGRPDRGDARPPGSYGSRRKGRGLRLEPGAWLLRRLRQTG